MRTGTASCWPGGWRLSACVLLAAGFCAAPAAAETEIVVGHIISQSGSRQAAEKFNEISARLPGVKITYDHAFRGMAREPDRLMREERLADVMVVYAGPTYTLNEVAGLARAGRIRPLDQLPGAQERLRLDDFYPNVLAPMRFDGHLWALPTRMVVPVVLDHSETLDSSTWEALIRSAESSSFGSAAHHYNLPGKFFDDLYLLWRTLILQRGLELVQNGAYALEDPRCAEAFSDVYRLYLSSAEKADIWLASSDVITDFPQMREGLVHDFPMLVNGRSYCAASTWYVAVRADVTEAQAEAIVQLLEVLLGAEMQARVMHSSYAVPVRPSIVEQMAQEVPHLAPLFAMAPRLRFRMPGKFSEQAEILLEQAFANALQAPQNYHAIMQEAAEAIAKLERR